MFYRRGSEDQRKEELLRTLCGSTQMSRKCASARCQWFFGRWVKSGRIVLQKQICRYSCSHEFRARTRGRQKLLAAEQRVPPAGEQPSVATRVEAAQVGPDEAMGRALASAADMVDKEQMCEEKPVSLIGSHCQTFCDPIMVMRDASGVSEVKYKNLMKRRVRRPDEKRMYEIQRKAGRLFLHGDLWDRWSRGLSFAREMCFPKRGTCCNLRSVCVIEDSSTVCCSKDGQTKVHVKNFMKIVFRGLRRVIDSVKVIGSKEVGMVSEDLRMNSDEYTKEVQYVVGRSDGI